MLGAGSPAGALVVLVGPLGGGGGGGGGGTAVGSPDPVVVVVVGSGVVAVVGVVVVLVGADDEELVVSDVGLPAVELGAEELCDDGLSTVGAVWVSIRPAGFLAAGSLAASFFFALLWVAVAAWLAFVWCVGFAPLLGAGFAAWRWGLCLVAGLRKSTSR